MKPPFSTEQFFSIFEKYNFAVFPAQLILLVAALGILILPRFRSMKSIVDKIIGLYLGFLWIWMGAVYHLMFFSTINKAALVFGIVFILQGLLFLYNTIYKSTIGFNFQAAARTYIGYFFILFGLIIYPIISYLLEGEFQRIISVGLPCPSTILTFGFVLMASSHFPKYLLIIPTIWAIIGLSAAVNLGVYQDFSMIIVALFTNIYTLKQRSTNPAIAVK